MAEITLPNNWSPRNYQRKLWDYLEGGGKRAVAVWHRRAGKDEVCLHWAAIAAHQRVATYWHMLPEAAQARKAIWEAINPHTGKRRIDEAFPHELRATTREQEMMIKFKCGSTWQVVGSDNFNSLVGSPPAGVVFSEWSLANSASWGYLRPILAENGGWALFIYTPRGKNHGWSTFKSAQSEPEWFAEKLPVSTTNALPIEVLEAEERQLKKEHGEEAGRSFYEQEYECSFDAAILGSVYGEWILKADKEGRIGKVEHDPELDVHTAWDLGYSDKTAIWFFQVVFGEVRVIDYLEASNKGLDYYVEQIYARRNYNYGVHNLPHDSTQKILAAGGRSILEQLRDKGLRAIKIPVTTKENSIQAARQTLPVCFFDEARCEQGIEMLKRYQYEYDSDSKVFKKSPLHDEASHGANAFELLARVWRTQKKVEKDDGKLYDAPLTLDYLYRPESQSPAYYDRI